MATRSDVLRLDIDVRNQRANQSLDKFTRKAQTSGKKSAQAFDQFTGSVNKLRNVLYLGGAGALAVGGLRTLEQLGRRADQITAVSRGFETLTRRVGETRDSMLFALRPAAQGLISDLELMKQTNNAILLGLPVTAESMARLTDSAVKLGRAMGRDAVSSIESMITGIGRQSRLMLDNLGIVVSMEAAYSKYAASIGKVAGELTEAQKKLAFYNEVSVQAEEMAANLDGHVVTLTESFAGLSVEIGNALDRLLDFINRGGRQPLQTRRPRSNIAPDSNFPANLGRTDSRLDPLQSLIGLDPAVIAAAFEPLPFLINTALEPLDVINQEMARFIENTNAQVLANRELAVSLETTAAKYDVLRGALSAGAQAFLVMAQTGQFSARSLANAVAQQVFGVLSALAIENIVRGFQEKALSIAAAARFDARGAAFHAAASKAHFATAAKAGAGAGAALGVVGFTSSGSGASGSPVGGNFAGTGFGAPLGAGNAQRPIEITIIVEGSGGSEETAREVARQVERQMRRAGARG